MLDVLITSSSRPQLFPYFWESFKKMMIIRQPHNIYVHEDFVFQNESRQVMNYLSVLQRNNKIQGVYSHNPAIGLGPAMDFMFKKHIKSNYMLYFQEDWQVERPIDVDQLIWVMDNNPEVNLIAFNKTHNTRKLNKALQPEYTYGGVDMCLYHSWTFLPGLWRMPFVRGHWRVRDTRPEGYFSNAFGTHDQRMDCDYCEKVIGAYMLGKTGDFRYVRHIGNDWRMAKWRLEDGKPGGCHEPERMDFPFIAPWVPFEERPVQKPKPNKEEIEAQIGENPPETQ
jgi:hypothetical protein